MKYINLFCSIRQKKAINSYSIGKIAEEKAVNYLKKLGYNILAQNFKTKYGEIDIIAFTNNTLIACEVKCRANADILPYVISSQQQQRISNALLLYLQKYPQYENKDLRFDVILINNHKITQHIENAW